MFILNQTLKNNFHKATKICVRSMGHCADQFAYDIKVPRERFETIGSRGTWMSYADRSAQRRMKSNTPRDTCVNRSAERSEPRTFTQEIQVNTQTKVFITIKQLIFRHTEVILTLK